jgi:amidase
VPIVLKDLGCHSAGDPFHCGMRLLRDAGWTEDDDAPTATMLRSAGFVFVGRTNTPELGLMPTTEPEAYGPTRNPWDVSRSSGGSSGGAAAAVASGMVALAHASDSGGSIRIPASECALVGLKPSRGAVPTKRIGDLAGLNVEHVITRSVRDSAAVLEVLRGSRQAHAPQPGRLRVGLVTVSPGDVLPVHADCVAAARDAGLLLESLGHHVEEAHPPALDELGHLLHYGAVVAVDTLAILGGWSTRLGRAIGPEDVEPHTWMLAEMGRTLSAEQIRDSLDWLAQYSGRVAGWWGGGFDLLLTPTLAEPPPPLGDLVSTRDEPFKGGWRAGALTPFTTPFNTTGQPAMSVPLYWNGDGLPIGVQLVAGPGREDVLLRVAEQLEMARP